MSSRYEKKVTHECTICRRKDLKITEMHHQIGRTFINKRATEEQLRYLANGLEIESPRGLQELRHALIHKFPQNVTEMCTKCHRMTDSHIAWQHSTKRKSRSRPWIGHMHRRRMRS